MIEKVMADRHATKWVPSSATADRAPYQPYSRWSFSFRQCGKDGFMGSQMRAILTLTEVPVMPSPAGDDQPRSESSDSRSLAAIPGAVQPSRKGNKH